MAVQWGSQNNGGFTGADGLIKILYRVIVPALFVDANAARVVHCWARCYGAAEARPEAVGVRGVAKPFREFHPVAFQKHDHGLVGESLIALLQAKPLLLAKRCAIVPGSWPGAGSHDPKTPAQPGYDDVVGAPALAATLAQYFS